MPGPGSTQVPLHDEPIRPDDRVHRTLFVRSVDILDVFGGVHAERVPRHGCEHSIALRLPPLAALVLRYDGQTGP